MAERAIVLGVTADLAFAAGALLGSILAQNPGFDADVVIFHDGLPESQQAAFRALWPRCRFRSFTAADVEARLGVSILDPKVQGYFAHLTHMVLAKLELPDLLDDYAQVVWLDADMLVRGRLSALWEFDCLAWRPLAIGGFDRRAGVLAAFADRGLDPSVPLLNGGVIGVGRQFRDLGGSRALLHDLARDLIRQAPPTQLAEMPWFLAAALRGLPVSAYPMRLNHSVAASGVAEATIAHAIGRHKFWNTAPLRQVFPDWLAHQKTWAAAGGQPYAGPILLADTHPEEASQVLRAAEMRDFWQRMFRRIRPLLPPGFQADLRHDQPVLTLYLPGRADDEHLSLIRMPNPERLRLALRLPEAVAAKAWAALGEAVPKARAEKGGTRSVTVTELGPALAAIAAALS